MQQDFETTALEIYQPFIHKQARSYFRKYASCTLYGAIDYEEFYQEAAMAFLEAIRGTGSTGFPLAKSVISVAKQCIQHRIFRNIILSYDGIHRSPPSRHANTAPHKTLSSLTDESLLLSNLQSNAEEIDNVDLIVTLESLPHTQSIVAICLINGISAREMVRRHILPRRKIQQAVGCLRVVFAK